MGIIQKTQEFQVMRPAKRIESFTVIGDPGCDGMGATPMSVFSKALSSADGDFTLLVGDIVPTGRKNLYQNMAEFIEITAHSPIYCLPGNHDTKFYTEYFGARNYALAAENLLLIALDNADRTFSEETLRFLSDTISEYEDRPVIISFHIPPPNPVCKNSVKRREWEKVGTIVQKYRSRIRYIVCGHVHSYYETVVDGVPLLVTGGGGARIEFVNEEIDQSKAAHHLLCFSCGTSERNTIDFQHRLLADIQNPEPADDPEVRKALQHSFSEEAVAHVRYRFYAEEAEDAGFPHLARLFRAAADAEYYHARNHFYVGNGMGSLLEMVEGSLSREGHEVDHMYREYLRYCEEHNHGLARYTFFDALAAERVHRELFQKARAPVARGEDIDEETYYTCTSCGYTFIGEEHPSRCPICGAPRDKIRRLE